MNECVYRDRRARVNSGRHDLPCLLIGNKADLDDQRGVEFELAARWGDLWNIGYIETSAKTKLNVNKVHAARCSLIDEIVCYTPLRKLTIHFASPFLATVRFYP